MKTFIHDVKPNQKIFYAIINGKREAFYLSNRLGRIFFPILQKDLLVDFEVKEKVTRRVGKALAIVYPVSHFTSIIVPETKKTLYDLHDLRLEMKKVLLKHKYFLFLDLEMSMPGYGKEKFVQEIIQVGYVLSDHHGTVLKDKGYYLLPQNEYAINKRTIKFLNLNELEYYGKGKEFDYFYEELKQIIETYHPKIVVWGKNDVIALQNAYKLHSVKSLTQEKSFIDLLMLHKNFYNLENDLGLFDAYLEYYRVEELTQSHDARTDAIITKDVFDAFLNEMKRI